MKANHLFHLTHSQLDNNTVQIEFTLISIVQGLALAVLADQAITPLSDLNWSVWPYITAGFILILLFWTQAMIHALSFIRWPIDFIHTFLYFLIMFVEVLAFSHLTEPIMWYAFNLIFFILAGILYFVDLHLINETESDYKTASEIKLFRDIQNDQSFSLRFYVPLGLTYMFLALAALCFFPDIFIIRNYHLLFILGQLIIGLIVLAKTLKNFRKRTLLITNACSKE
jgi:hypothetical protein